MSARTVVRCLAACLSAAAASAAETVPPRPIGGHEGATANCLRMHGRDADLAGEVKVTVTVNAAGRVTGASSAPGTPEALAAAAQCVAVTMRFEPARGADGEPSSGKATVAIGFPTPPQLRADLSRAVEYCQPAIQPAAALRRAKANAFEGTLDLRVLVGKDGRVIESVPPEGVLPWMSEAADCLEGQLDFYPARLGLEPVEAWTLVTADFNLTKNPHERVRLEPPTVRSGDEEILSAYRACYPAGRSDQARVTYRVTISEGGRVRTAEVAVSSGDSALDAAGQCILHELVFTPARRNGVNVESTLSWPLLVRPAATPDRPDR